MRATLTAKVSVCVTLTSVHATSFFLVMQSEGSVVFKSYDKSSGVSLRSSKVSHCGKDLV